MNAIARRKGIAFAWSLLASMFMASSSPSDVSAAPDAGSAAKVIIDTDIGTDIDDAFAVALALSSPDIHVLGITTTSGNVRLRARLVDRLLFETGQTHIPVAVGKTTAGPYDASGKPVTFTQARWAEASPVAARRWPPATPFILDEIRRFPGQISLVCIGPLTNIAALVRRDPATFRKLKRIVLMGGSIHVGFADGGRPPQPPPVAEYNIVQDIPAAQTVFESGVHIDMLPLDSTQVRLEESLRDRLFAAGTPLTDALTLLYHEWSELNPWGKTPTLYDVVALTHVFDPALCPVEPMHVTVDGSGYTRPGPGAANVSVCLHVHENALLDVLMTRLLRQHLHA
jgi:inosine-uridine nucleoside N-ribohydrolase